jgi:hypothetical protein
MQDEEQIAEAQQVLDALRRERLIPFSLTAYKIEANGLGEYMISFNDSRIHSCRFSWKQGEDFREVFRAAIIARVNRRSGPLRMGASNGETAS